MYEEMNKEEEARYRHIGRLEAIRAQYISNAFDLALERKHRRTKKMLRLAFRIDEHLLRLGSQTQPALSVLDAETPPAPSDLDGKTPEAYKDAFMEKVIESVGKTVEGISKIAEDAAGAMELDERLEGLMEGLAETGREFEKVWNAYGKDWLKE
ncbi:MAG: hypothetical protein LBL83_11375 [Clostridiales bacterium]|jgi:hypothetical protein|nr:hypothetical protein [Clostridiales bacterium]